MFPSLLVFPFLVSSLEVSIPRPCNFFNLVKGIESPLITCPAALSLPGSGEEEGRGGCASAMGLAENFEFVQELNGGYYGKVLEMKTKEGKSVAVKEMLLPSKRADKKERKNMIREEVRNAYLLGSVSPSHFVTLHLAFNFENGSCLVFEKLEEDLFDVARSEDLAHTRNVESRSARLPENAAREIVSQLLEGLHKSHEAGIELGDLKLENVMLDRPVLSFLNNGGKAKMVDFGGSKVRKSSSLRRSGFPVDSSVSGTAPGYIPPSFYLSSKNRADFHGDVFAVGTILLKLLVGGDYFPGFRISCRSWWEVRGVSHTHRTENTAFLAGVSRDPFNPILAGWNLDPLPPFVMSDWAEEVLRVLLDPNTYTPAWEVLRMPWFTKSADDIKTNMLGKLEEGTYLNSGVGPWVRRKMLIVKRNLLPYLDSDLNKNALERRMSRMRVAKREMFTLKRAEKNLKDEVSDMETSATLLTVLESIGDSASSLSSLPPMPARDCSSRSVDEREDMTPPIVHAPVSAVLEPLEEETGTESVSTSAHGVEHSEVAASPPFERRGPSVQVFPREEEEVEARGPLRNARCLRRACVIS